MFHGAIVFKYVVVLGNFITICMNEGDLGVLGQDRYGFLYKRGFPEIILVKQIKILPFGKIGTTVSGCRLPSFTSLLKNWILEADGIIVVASSSDASSTIISSKSLQVCLKAPSMASLR